MIVSLKCLLETKQGSLTQHRGETMQGMEASCITSGPNYLATSFRSLGNTVSDLQMTLQLLPASCIIVTGEFHPSTDQGAVTD
jgi:hypothetical protein